jgi:magnesium-transporting ATPase (P-type)
MLSVNTVGASADLLRQLDTSSEGLATAEAERRLLANGLNEPARDQMRTTFRELLRATANPLNIILIVAAVAAAFLGEVVDAAIIATIVVLSTALNYWLAFRSERAMRQ